VIAHVCDPAKSGKDRGFALYASTAFVPDAFGLCKWGAAPCYGQGACWGVVEAQWANPEASRQSLVTLAARAGFCFTLVPAARYAMIPPTTAKLTKVDAKRLKRTTLPGWKDILIPGFGNADGDVFTRSILDLLRRMKHPAARETNHNVLDAIGIALAVGRIVEGHAAARGVSLEHYEIT